MIDAFAIRKYRSRTLILLSICALAAIAAAILGIDDNPPGILCAYLAALALVLAIVHPWRTARRFRSLLYASLLGFALFAVLNNAFAALAHSPATSGALQLLLQALAVACFLIATLISPAAFLVSALGMLILSLRSRRRLA